MSSIENNDSALASDDGKKIKGLVRFYGLYWHRKHVNWDEQKILGQPKGWLGQGNKKKGDSDKDHQMNFWGQKGVYVLYDSMLHPIYVGQGGLVKSNSTENSGKSIGVRLSDHAKSKIRNSWEIFSWFGFQDTEKLNLRTADEPARMNPQWNFGMKNGVGLNSLLDAFEGILIETCSPRFNARGGNMDSGIYVNQYEDVHTKAA